MHCLIAFPCTKRCVIHDDDPKLAYGRKKILAEEAALRFSEQTDLPVTVLRLPAVYGEYDHQAREWYFIKRLFGSAHPYCFTGRWMWCCIIVNMQASRGQLKLLIDYHQKSNQIYNSGHRHTPSYRRLVETAAEITENM
jgi:nucleoside-diphosphate-sugar epimerase